MSKEKTEPNPNQALAQHKSEWTTDQRFRLDVQMWPNAIILSCETEAASFDKQQLYPFIKGRIVIPGATLRPDAEDFAEHAFSYFHPELGKLAMEEVRKAYATLQPADPTPSPSNAPPGMTVN